MAHSGGALGARGTARIVAGEREVEILFTNRALAEAEAAVGRSIVGILEGFQQNTCGVTETVKLLRVGMEAARRDSRTGGHVVTDNDAFEVLDRVGYTRVLTIIMEAIAVVLGYDAEGEATTEAESPNA